MSSLEPNLRWRYAVKKYDATRTLDRATIASLRAATRLAPSSFGLQPYRAIFVEDPQLRAQLRAASFNQPQITEASCLVVFAVETRIDEAYVDRQFALRAQVTQAPLAAYRDSVWRSVQRVPKHRRHDAVEVMP